MPSTIQKKRGVRTPPLSPATLAAAGQPRAMLQPTDNIAPIVDALGRVKAQIAPLVEREKSLKAELAALGAGEYAGKLFDAAVSYSEREVFSREVAEKFLTPAQIKKCLSYSDVTTVRVSARVRRG